MICVCVCKCEFANVYEFQSNFNRISICKTLLLFTSEKKCFCEGCYCKIEIMFFMDDNDENHRCFQMIFSKKVFLLCFSIASEFDFFWLSFYMMFFSMMENIFFGLNFLFFFKKSLNKFRDFQRKLSNGNGISIWLIISEKKTMDGWNEKKKIIENDQSIDRSIDQIAKFQCCWWLFYYMQKAIKQQTLT